MPAFIYRDVLRALQAEEIRYAGIDYLAEVWSSSAPFPYNLRLFVGNVWCLTRFPVTTTVCSVFSRVLDFSHIEPGVQYHSIGRHEKAIPCLKGGEANRLTTKWERWSVSPVKTEWNLTPFLLEGDLGRKYRIMQVLDQDALPRKEEDFLRFVPQERVDWLTHDLFALRQYKYEALLSRVRESSWSDRLELVRVSRRARVGWEVMGFFTPGPRLVPQPDFPLPVSPLNGPSQQSLLG